MIMIRAAVDRCLADGTPFDLEQPFITAMDRRFWVRLNGQADFQAGKVVRVWLRGEIWPWYEKEKEPGGIILFTEVL
jgi:hypothetical protein